jgi:Tol biopolymer transport system component
MDLRGQGAPDGRGGHTSRWRMKYPGGGPQGASSAVGRSAGPALVFAALTCCTLSSCGRPYEPPEEAIQDLAPAWSPDGARLALQHEGPDATPGVYLLQLGATKRQLVLPGATSPDWSPDGTRLVAQSGSQVVQLDLESGTSTVLSAAESFSGFPAWSPDGRYVALSSNGGDNHSPPDLWLVRIDPPGLPHRVPLGGPPRDEMWEKDWAPSSDRLVMSVAGTPQRLFVTDTSGRDTAYISPPNVDARMPAWSPHGDWIAYVRGSYAGGIWLIRPDGSGDHQVVRSGAYPTWSPDGERIAFSRPSGPTVAIWSVKVDGSSLEQLTFP